MSRPAIASWCLYDWASSAFNTVIGTFIFSVYFAQAVYGDATEGSVVWGYAIGGAGLAVALVGPLLGAIADQSGRRKPWIAGFTALCIVATAFLYLVEPGRAFVFIAVVLVVIATIAFELGSIFYNASLQVVAPRDKLGRVSGCGWSLGYFGGLCCLGLALVGLVQPDVPWFGFGTDAAQQIRATALLTAVWFGLFSIPYFFFVPDSDKSSQSVGQLFISGLGQLCATIRDVRRHGPIVIFLIASALYRDGLATLFAFGGLYAAGVYLMDIEEIMIFAIALNVTAGLGALSFAWFDDRFGSKDMILASLAGLLLFGFVILFVDDQQIFFWLALGLGFFVGPTQSASRSLMTRLSPDAMETEMFGLYAMTGKSAAFLGPIFYAMATDFFGTQRAGLVTILAAWLLGGLFLFFVPAPRPNGGSVASR